MMRRWSTAASARPRSPDVYVPLAQRAAARGFSRRARRRPVPVVAVVGSVAVGKSTTARALRELTRRAARAAATSSWWRPTASCSRTPCSTRRASPCGRDSPRATTSAALAQFLAAARAGADELPRAGVLPRAVRRRPGVRAGRARDRARRCSWKACALDRARGPSLVDFVIYLDADERDIRDWFLARFARRCSPKDLLEIAYAGVGRDQRREPARAHPPDSRERADVVLEKRADHVVRGWCSAIPGVTRWVHDC